MRRGLSLAGIGLLMALINYLTIASAPILFAGVAMTVVGLSLGAIEQFRRLKTSQPERHA